MADEYKDLISKYADRYGIKPEIAQRMFAQESNLDPNAVSGKGAQGLGQLMPETAKSLGVTDINDPEQNIEASLRYLKQNLDKNNGDYKLALASYNAGPGAVSKYGGIPPFKETQDYVSRIMGPPTKIDWGAVAATPKIDWASVAKTSQPERLPEIGEGAEAIGPRPDNPITNWFEDLKGDVRAGTGITAPGRLLQKIGNPKAGYTPESNIAAGPFVGPPEIGHGLSQLLNPNSSGMERVRGFNEGAGGVAKTVAPILGVTNPAFLPTVVGYGGVGELAHKGAEQFTKDPDIQDLVSNIAMLASPSGKRLMGPAGDFVSKAAPVAGKVAGIGTGLIKTLRTGNPTWLLTGMPPLTGAISKATDLTGKAMRGLSDLHPFDKSTPEISLNEISSPRQADLQFESPKLRAFKEGLKSKTAAAGAEESPLVEGPRAMPEQTVADGGTGALSSEELNRGNHVLIDNQGNVKEHLGKQPDLSSKTPEAGKGAVVELNADNSPKRVVSGKSDIDTSKIQEALKQTPQTNETKLSPQDIQDAVNEAIKSMKPQSPEEPEEPGGAVATNPEGPNEPPPLIDARGLGRLEGPKPQFDKQGLEMPQDPRLGIDGMDRELSDEQREAINNDLIDTSGLREPPVSNDDINLEKWWANQEPKLKNEVLPENQFPESNMEDIFNIAHAWVKSRPDATREEFISRFAPRGREAAGQAFDAAKGAEHIEKNPESLISTEPLTKSIKSDNIKNMANSEENEPSQKDFDGVNKLIGKRSPDELFTSALEFLKSQGVSDNDISSMSRDDIVNIARSKGFNANEHGPLLNNQRAMGAPGGDSSTAIQKIKDLAEEYRKMAEEDRKTNTGTEEDLSDLYESDAKNFEKIAQMLENGEDANGFYWDMDTDPRELIADILGPDEAKSVGLDFDPIESGYADGKFDDWKEEDEKSDKGAKDLQNLIEPPKQPEGKLKIYLKDGKVGIRPSQKPGMVEMGIEIDGKVHVYEIPTKVWKSIKKDGFVDLGPQETRNIPVVSPGEDRDITELERIESLKQPEETPKPEDENKKPKGSGVARPSKKERKIQVEEPKTTPSKIALKKQALAEVNKLFDNDQITPDEYEERLREIEHRFRTNQP